MRRKICPCSNCKCSKYCKCKKYKKANTKKKATSSRCCVKGLNGTKNKNSRRNYKNTRKKYKKMRQRGGLLFSSLNGDINTNPVAMSSHLTGAPYHISSRLDQPVAHNNNYLV